MLTIQGKLSRSDTAQFLRDCDVTLEPRNQNYVWCGWIDAIAWLGLEELKPMVEQAFARGSIDPTWLTFKHFEADLQHAVTYPDDPVRYPDGKITLFEDTIAELSTWHFAEPEESVDALTWPLIEYWEPERNPFRTIGRNDPCPCGSGRKFKKCCLYLDREESKNYLKAS